MKRRSHTSQRGLQAFPPTTPAGAAILALHKLTLADLNRALDLYQQTENASGDAACGYGCTPGSGSDAPGRMRCAR